MRIFLKKISKETAKESTETQKRKDKKEDVVLL